VAAGAAVELSGDALVSLATGWWPTWSADKAATVQACAAIGQAVLTVIALGIAIWVPARQQRWARADDLKRRADELTGLRHGLHAEVATIGHTSMEELNGWRTTPYPEYRSLRKLKLLRLMVYEANASRIGFLTLKEILTLIGLSEALGLISIAAEQMEQTRTQSVSDRQWMQVHLSHVCLCAADFLEAVPGIEVADDDFTEKLRAAHRSTETLREELAVTPG
jgi:hypothetical protein